MMPIIGEGESGALVNHHDRILNLHKYKKVKNFAVFLNIILCIFFKWENYYKRILFSFRDWQWI